MSDSEETSQTQGDGGELKLNIAHAGDGEGEVLIRSGLDADGRSSEIKLCPNGDIYINGRLTTNAMEVVEGMRDFVNICMKPKMVY